MPKQTFFFFFLGVYGDNREKWIQQGELDEIRGTGVQTDWVDFKWVEENERGDEVVVIYLDGNRDFSDGDDAHGLVMCNVDIQVYQFE